MKQIRTTANASRAVHEAKARKRIKIDRSYKFAGRGRALQSATSTTS